MTRVRSQLIIPPLPLLRQGDEIKSKTKTLDGVPASLADVPMWSFDSSTSTRAAPEHAYNIVLKPAALFRDPFRRGENILVLCDLYTPDKEPLEGNTRAPSSWVMDKAKASDPWFGMAQQFSIGSGDADGEEAAANHFCSVGATANVRRSVVEAFYRATIFAGVKIASCNAEAGRGRWSYSIGPCEGIEAGDHAWISRFLLLRVAEIFGARVSFRGGSCHTHFSTQEMRDEGGMAHIIAGIKNLEACHGQTLRKYGYGKAANSDMRWAQKPFSYAVANGKVAVNIPRSAETDGRGYFEDRRPPSDADPYVVISELTRSTFQDEE